MASSPSKTAYIIRRQSTGGGAEKAAQRLLEHLAPAWTVHRLCAGTCFENHRIGGAKGPNWWRAARFSRQVDALLAGKPGVRLSLERGPDCHIYRAGDGVHLRWRNLRFGSSRIWMTNPLHWLYPRLEAKTVRSAKFVAANSDMIRREMEEYYPHDAHKLRVIHNGFDPAVFFPDPSVPSRLKMELGLFEQCKLFLFVGGGWERKGLARAIELVAAYNRGIASNDPPGMLVVVGKGDPRKFLRHLQRLKMTDAVRFLAPKNDIRIYYQGADFFVLPTTYDPFSNACLEALACGCPVITTRTNGVSEVIDHGRSGFILGENQAEAVAWCRTATIGRRAVAETVARLTVEKELRAFSALMEQCLGKE